MNTAVLKACAWSGIGCLVLYLGGFWLIAGFIPPPSPAMSPEAVAEFFRADINSIRAGMIVSSLASVLMAPLFTAIAVHMRRIEGRYSPLAFLQLGLGMILVFEFVYLIMFWEVAAFRPNRSPELFQLVNDMAWLPFIAITFTTVVQTASIATAILRDNRAETRPGTQPVYPRWVGYFNIWAALAFCGGSFAVFFQDGPLAWNGVIAFYMPLSTFCSWLIIMVTTTLKATAQLETAEEHLELNHSSNGNHSGNGYEALALELADVRRELARVSADTAR